MAVTLDQIGDAILAAIRDNATILSTCNSLYSSPHSVFLNAPDRLTPEQAFMPLFSVLCIQKSNPEIASKKDYSVVVGVSVHDANKTENTTANGVYTLKYSGQKNVETLIDLALSAIRSMSSNITISASDMEIMYGDGDIWSARYQLTIQIQNLIGAEMSL